MITILSVSSSAKFYTRLTYAHIHHCLLRPAQERLNLLGMYSEQDRFSDSLLRTCSELPKDANKADSIGATTLCSVWVVEMSSSDTLSSDPSRPEWLVNGKLHGDEAVASLVVLTSIARMVSNHEPSQFVRRMIDTHRTILVIITNAIGDFMGFRTEVQEGKPASLFL